MQKIKFIIVFFIVAQIIFNHCNGQNIIISSNGHHGSVDCAASFINMQVDNPNPNYIYSWHYVFFDSIPGGGGCNYDNSMPIGTGTNVNVSTNVGKIFAIECYADSGGMLWDGSHWFKVRKPDLKIPLCINGTFSCGEKEVNVPEVFFVDSAGTFTKQWFKNGIPVNLNGAGFYTLNSSGYYYLRLKVGTCGYAFSDSIHVTTTFPSAVITATGPTTFCTGGSVTLNAPVAANRSYQWKKGGNLIPGAGLSSYTATTGGNYKVIVTNTITGCTKTTGNATVVTVNALPAATVTPQGPTTFCAGGSVVLAANTGTGLTYKWKKNGNFIPGATSSNYTATTAGKYKVQVTNSNGCSKTSASVTVSVPCRNGEIISSVNHLDFTVYPNPNPGEFIIKFSSKPASSIQIQLTDETGRVVKKFETADETLVIKESNLTKGIYCLTATNKDEVAIKKINIVK